MKTATARLELDRRNLRQDGTRPVRLIVYFNGEKKRYPLNVHLSDEIWGKIYGDRLRDLELKAIKSNIEAAKRRAEAIAEELGANFDFALFEKIYYDIHTEEDNSKYDVYLTFDKYVAELFAAQRIGTATSYQTARRSLESFCPKLTFAEVTPKFLKRYEEHILGKDSSITTVAIYLRSLRTIVNIAKEAGVITHEQYPFGQRSKKKYEIPVGRNIKKALSAEEIRKIRDAVPAGPEAGFARDIWLFSFYCNGMNMTDICSLKYEDVKDSFIYYFRAKTIRTQREKIPVEVYLSDAAKAIIERWGTKPALPSGFIFPVLDAGQTTEEQFWASKNFTRSVNHYMDMLGQQLGINCKLTTYVARHSYATLLKFMGTSIEEISESLGHSNISTTRSYLDSFPKEHKKATSDKLTALI